MARGSLAGDLTQSSAGNPVEWTVPNAVSVWRRCWRAIGVLTVRPGLWVVGDGVDRGLGGRELVQP